MKKIVKWYQTFFLTLLMFAGTCACAEPAKLTEVTITSTSDSARVVIRFSKLPLYKRFTLDNPPRLVFDFNDTVLDAELANLNLQPTPFSSIRSGHQSTSNLRLVLDMKQPSLTNSFSATADKTGQQLILQLGLLPPVKEMLNKLTVDKRVGKTVQENKQSSKLKIESTPKLPAVVDAQKAANESRLLAEKMQAEIAKPLAVSPKEETPLKTVGKSEIVSSPAKILTAGPKARPVVAKNLRDVVIVIDPGHGGKDPGAHGSHGTREKSIVLAISKKLQTLINQQPGMRSVLTRKGDYFITLRERLRIARRSKGDLFVAIHADAFDNPHSSGASVFALSARGASSEAARWLAEKENYSELGAIPLADKSDALRSVLIDLSQTGIIRLSLQLGSYMLSDIGKIARLHHGSVEQARFVVLKSLDIPSVLVETGFISNQQEEQQLADPVYQQKLAEAIFSGIYRYFQQYPPPGTRLAAEKDNPIEPKLAQATSNISSNP